MDVLVVGGAESLLSGAFGQKLAQHNIHAKWHEVRPARIEVIPEAAEGIVIIKDMVSHALSGAAISLAKLKGIPFVQVTRKFSHAYPVLRDSGFLSFATKEVVVKATPTPAPAPAPMPIAATPPKEEPMPPAADDLAVAMDLVFKEDPYCIKNAVLVQQKLRELTRTAPSLPEVVALCQSKKDYLKSLSGRWIRDADKIKQREHLRNLWLTSFCSDFYQRNNRLPKYRDVNEEAGQYFGSSLEGSFVAQVLRDAQKLLQQPPAPEAVTPALVPVPAPVPAPATKAAPEMWDRLSEQVAALTSQLNVMAGQLTTLLRTRADHDDALETLLSKVNALDHNHRTVTARVRQLEEPAAQPSQPQTVPESMSVLEALAKLSALGFTVKIESK